MKTIEEYKKQLTLFKEEQKLVLDEQRRITDKLSDLNKEINYVTDKIYAIEADDFKSKEHEIIKWKDIPINIREDFFIIRSRIKQGCTGDPYDGCRGCSENCEHRAYEEFMKKYNIKKIL